MAAEMAAQPQVLDRIIRRAGADAAAVRAAAPRPLAGTVFLARGSSDNAAVLGRYLAELRAGRPAGLAAPSIYTRYHAAVDWHGYLVVALSQSGATPEIVSTCRAMRAAGAVVIGITNEPDSPLAGVVSLLLCTDAGPELAVPATKTVTAQAAVLVTLACALRRPEPQKPAPRRPEPQKPAPRRPEPQETSTAAARAARAPAVTPSPGCPARWPRCSATPARPATWPGAGGGSTGCW